MMVSSRMKNIPNAIRGCVSASRVDIHANAATQASRSSNVPTISPCTKQRLMGNIALSTLNPRYIHCSPVQGTHGMNDMQYDLTARWSTGFNKRQFRCIPQRSMNTASVINMDRNNDPSPDTSSAQKSNTLNKETIAMLILEIHSVYGSQFTHADKLELLEMCINNGVIHHREVSILMLELWKHIGRMRHSDILRYNKLCSDAADAIFSGAASRDRKQAYELQFHIDLEVLDKDMLCPTTEQYRTKQTLIDSLKPILEKVAKGTLHTFGSCENGLWVRGSDVDMCLEIPNCNQKRQWLSKLNLVRSALRDNALVSSISIISAKVPIAKLYDGDNHNFCDISINNTVALDNTRFVKTMTALDERVVKLARFIKYWATRRCINNRAQGTLSSYTLILQVFYFLQNRTVPILPKFMEIELDSNDDRRLFITDSNDIYKKCGYLGKNNETITQLVFDFFRFYSDKQFQGGRKGATVDLYTNTVVDNTLGVLVMKCPITGKNVNPFTIRMWQSIYREFRRVNEYISQERPVSQICQKADLPPLEREAEIKRYHTLLLKQLVAHVNSMKPAPKATAALRWT